MKTFHSQRLQPAMVEFPVERLVRVWSTGPNRAGTGFRFAADRVLTARHVVHGAEQIEVLDRDGTEWRVQRTVWPAEGTASGFDVVVLETEPKEDVSAWPVLAREPWKTADPWESRGFPSASREPKNREPLSGPGMECLEGDEHFTLRVDGTRTPSVKTWEGISGAPVFRVIASQMVLSGVITEGPEKFKGSVLRAVPLPALLRGESFRSALLGDEPDWVEEYIPMIQALLDDERVAETVVPILTGEPKGRLPGDAAARRVCKEVPLASICLALARAVQESAKKGETESAGRVLDVLCAVSPPGFLRAMGLTPHPPGSDRMNLEVATDLAAEACVAAADRRPMRLEPRADDVPAAKLRVPKPGRFDIDPDGTNQLLDAAGDLKRLIELSPPGPIRSAKEYTVGLAEHFKLWPARHMQRLASMKTAEETWERAFVRAVNRRLGLLDPESRFYFLASLDEVVEGRDAFLEKLRTDLPALRLVTRTGNDPDQFDTEDDLLAAPFQLAFRGVTFEKDEEK